MNHYIDVELVIFLFALVFVTAAGLADYYSNHRYQSQDHALYRHEISAFYVGGSEAHWEYHVKYFTQLVSDASFIDDDVLTPHTEHDVVVPADVYHKLQLGMSFTTTSDHIEWSDLDL